ncbi:MAG: tRNA (adenosine(37)-N6)-threonylcarbamoyltransferase complex ATPase subunit type 1 TsaE [bacterium]
MRKIFTAVSESELIEPARFILSNVKAEIFLLRGTLGSGKTAFVRQFASLFDITGVTSPSFTIINNYSGSNITIVHIDLYRISENERAESLHFEELVETADYTFIEWPGSRGDELKNIYSVGELEFEYLENGRRITVIY